MLGREEKMGGGLEHSLMSYDAERPGTAASTFSRSGRTPGVKAQLARLERNLHDHQVTLESHTKQLESDGDDTAEKFTAMQREFDDKLDALQRDMETKLKTAFAEIERLQKQLTVQKGESTIFAQQQKDIVKRLNDLTNDFHDLHVDVNGDIDGGSAESGGEGL